MSASLTDPGASIDAASNRSQSKGKSVVAAVKDGAQSFGRRMRGVFPSTKPFLPQDGDHPPVYQRRDSAHLPAAPEVSIDYSYSMNPEMSYRITDTGGYGLVGTSQGHANLVVGRDRHTITIRERASFIEKHLIELDQLTTAAPAGGYPPHSVELFKVSQLVKTVKMLTDIRVPPQASREYREKIQGLIAVHERMVEMERSLAKAEVNDSISRPLGGSSSLE